MAGTLYRAVRPFLFRFDAEQTHDAALRALTLAAASAPGRRLLVALGGVSRPAPADALRMTFRNPIGLAAGFDKDGVAIGAWAALGFGFVELGTVTPRPQPGNARPRLFRLTRDQALINRMGFNNAGAAGLAARVAAARRRLPASFRIGVSIGRGAATSPSHELDDYREAYRAVAPHADYVAINVSSPNTAGLRDLEDRIRLARLVEALVDEPLPDRRARPPLVVKLSPDRQHDPLATVLDAIGSTPASGVILVNTTRARPRLRSPERLLREPGGLSGAPLKPLMLRSLALARERLPEEMTLVASGGVFDADDVRAALQAGASLVQIYTGFIYRGPSVVGELTDAAARMAPV
ncbi:MAG: quinone-dependent dihydroorotate dehydrogenase [Chloroflexota bacterium]|nr:quinone-dependent dihydroorotate dehydrogenase [Chloroflexota bacterium]